MLSGVCIQEYHFNIAYFQYPPSLQMDIIYKRGEGGLWGIGTMRAQKNYHEILCNFVYQEMEDKIFMF